ncbi:MAG: NAD(P)/FAD-dependent oxidoreductase [Gemmatimonadota bacterium]
MRSQYDIAIVGSSIAGASAAIALAPEGYSILLLDKAVFPREKPCGEGIMPQGAQILADLGLLPEVLARGGTKIRGMRYSNRQGVVAQSDFPPGESAILFGVVMRRYHLDHLLLRRARAFSNVTVREGFKVTDVVREAGVVRGIAGHFVDSRAHRHVVYASLTIAADGRYSIFHTARGLTKTYLRRRRFGITGHLGGVQGIGSYVEVLPHADGEIYVAPCGQDVSLVALLLEERAMQFFRGDLGGQYMSFLSRTEGFRDRISGARLIPPVFAVGPLGFSIEPCYQPGLLLIGDSAGFLDPITGEGMTLALKCVQAAVPLIREAFATGDFGPELGRRYAGARFQLIEDVFRFTRLLLNLSRYKAVGDRAIRRLSHDELLFRKLLGIVTGSHKYSDLSLGEKASLLMG